MQEPSQCWIRMSRSWLRIHWFLVWCCSLCKSHVSAWTIGTKYDGKLAYL